MSNLKNLKETLKLISEKKDPILSMYVGNQAQLKLVQDDNGEVSIKAELDNGKAKITTREIGKPDFLGKTEYEIIIRKNTGDRLEIISYKPSENTSLATTITKEDGFITKTNTYVEAAGRMIVCIAAQSEMYTFDTLSQMEPVYDYEKEPIQVIYGVLNSKGKKMDFLPVDYYDEFNSRLVETDNGDYKNITLTKDCDDAVFETEAYGYYGIASSVQRAYQEYASGELRSSTFDIKKSRNK